MAVGQVSFHSDKKVKRVHVATRENAIVNRINKTKVEKEVDHESERQLRLKDEGRRKKAEAIERVSLFHSLCLSRPNKRNVKIGETHVSRYGKY
jgi:hypothetical protein